MTTLSPQNYRSNIYPSLHYRFRSLYHRYKHTALHILAVFTAIATLSYYASHHVQAGIYMFAVQLTLWGLGTLTFNEILEALND